MKTLVWVALLSVLAGCQSSGQLESWRLNSAICPLVEKGCASEGEPLSLEDTDCSLAAWTRYMGSTLGMSEEQRALTLEQFSENKVEQLQQILILSHPAAGYRERLRAQLTLESTLDGLPPGLSQLFNTVYAYNQRLLENASALTLAERTSAQQQASIAELKAKLQALTQIEDQLRQPTGGINER